MKHLHPLIKPDHKGATAESNLQDIEVIRSLQDGPERDELINRMVQGNIPIVKIKVEGYIGLHPGVAFLSDDLMSEGVLALSLAIRAMANKEIPEKDNPTGYIVQRVIWQLARLVENNKDQRSIPKGYKPPYPLEIDPREIVEVKDLLEAACQTAEDAIIIEMREKGCTDQEIADRLEIPREAVRIQRHTLEQRYNALVKASL